MSEATAQLKQFRAPQTVISRFVARRSLRSAALWAVAFGAYVASKAIGFVQAYPTAQAQAQVATTFDNNIGIEILLGKAPQHATVAGYAAWNTLGVMVIIGGIWAMLLATNRLRGDEDAGRWEVLLTGQATARRATLNVLMGLVAILGLFFAVMAGAFSLVGQAHGVNYGAGPAVYFALAVTCGVLLFMTVGAFSSQLFATRGRATSMSLAFFGVAFLLRAIGDITNAHWLINFTSLGWVEKLQPLAQPDAVWFAPLLLSSAVLAAATVYLAGRRDLNDSIVGDNDTAAPELRFLNSVLGSEFRLTRNTNVSWLAAITIVALLYGLMTKSAAQVFSQSASAQKVLASLTQQSRLASVYVFLGVVFFLQMTLLMTYVANGLSAMRHDEAQGYLDNFLVRPLSRGRWLAGRLALIALSILSAACLTTLAIGIGVASQHTGASVHSLVQAGANLLPPVVLVAGIGVAAFGLLPRLTSLCVYLVIGWSFLVEMVSSGLKLNHWLLDTSVLHQVTFAPAADPNWHTNAVMTLLGVVLALVGVLSFGRRDLANE